MKILSLSLLSIVATTACGDKSDAEYRADVTAAMHDSIATDLDALVQAARDLQAAAPAPTGRGWDATQDAAAIASMRDAWRRARVAYELTEGALAPIFPDIDFAIDARYDDFLAEAGPDGDLDPFDGAGATGMHAIERILFAPEIRSEVITFESTLPGYRAAAYPATEAEAARFATGIALKLIDDVELLRAQWQPAAIDIGAAYQGLVGLMNEQKEKVDLAATGEEESRYANVTLFDLRNNLAGTRDVYGLFRAWIDAKQGDDPDAQIVARFGELDGLYATTAGDALPPVPPTWSSDAPSPADLATPFGMLWKQVHAAVDPTRSGSVVFEMNEVATLLGFPEFVAE